MTPTSDGSDIKLGNVVTISNQSISVTGPAVLKRALVFLTAIACAKTSAETATNQLERITVERANSATEDSTGRSQSVLSRREIKEAGTRTLSEILSKASGVVVSGAGSSAKEFSIAGLGSGYTQILIDGSPVPPDFLLSSIPADSIESVEVIRSVSADQRAQGIAGTLNIRLRRADREPRQSTRNVSISSYEGYVSSSLVATESNSFRGWRLGGTATVGDAHDSWSSTGKWASTSANSPGQSYISVAPERDRITSASFRPSASRKLEGGGVLSIDGLLQWEQKRYAGGEQFVEPVGSPLRLDSYTLYSTTVSSSRRFSAQYKAPLGQSSRIDLSFSGSDASKKAESRMDLYNISKAATVRLTDSSVSDSTASVRGKLASLLGDVPMSVGWDISLLSRDDDTVRREGENLQATLEYRVDRFHAATKQLAVFATADFEPSDATSTTIGLRWELLNSEASSRDRSTVTRRHSVLSPNFEARLHPFGSRSSQVKLSIETAA